MNRFRALARSFWNAIDFRRKQEGEGTPAAPKKEVSARSVFRPSARGDGFDAGARTAPVDLSGGVKLKYEVLEEAKPVIPPAESDFVASLDDLGLLIDELKQPDPEIIAPWEQPTVEPVDVFESATPLAEPLDFFEDSPPTTQLTVAAEPPPSIVPSGVEGLLLDSPPVTPGPADDVPLDSSRGPTPELTVAVDPPTPIVPSGVPVAPELTVAAEPPSPIVPSGVPVTPELTVAADPPTPIVPSRVEGLPVQPSVTDQPPVAPQAQFTVDLLVPVGAGSTVQRKPVEEFSTLELLDTVEQLSVVAPAADEAPADQPVEAPKP